MYYWRIRLLKRDLEARAVTERAALPYLLWLGGLTTLASSLPFGDPNRWDFAYALASLVLFATGTVYAYRCNGGSAGSDFFIRYLSINWVLLLRLLVLLVIPAMVGLLVLQELLFGEVPSETTSFDFGILVAFESIFYWRLGFHIRAVAMAPRAA